MLRPRYECTECGVLYGPLGVTRPKWGYCPGCWKVYLALLEQGTRKLHVRACEARGELPIWSDYVSKEEGKTDDAKSGKD